MFCYVGGGWYWPGQTIKDLQDEMRRHLDAGYTMVKMKVGGLPLDEDLRRLEAVLKVVGSGEQSRGRRQLQIRPRARRSPMPRRWRRSSCAGSRSRAIRSTSRCSPSSRASTRRRSRPARTSISTQDVENLVRFGGLRAERTTSSRSIRRRPTASRNTRARVAMLERHGWPRAALFPHGGNQMSLAIAAGFGLGGAESYPGVFGDFGGFADDARIEDGALTLSDRPGIGFEGQSALYTHHARARRHLETNSQPLLASHHGQTPGIGW